MKKVLIFAPTAPSSGITQYLLNILGKMASEDIRFDILSFRNERLKKWAEEHGGEYFEFDISPYKHPVLYRKFLKQVFSREYDVVHYNISAISTLLIFKYAKKYSNARLIVHSHACSIEAQSKLRYIVFDYVHKFLRAFANRYSDCKCACSVLAAEWMYGKKAAKNAIILNNAIDIEKFSYNENYRNELREELGIKTKYVLGHIGRFAVPKNHSFILDIFEEVLKRNDDCTLVLIGNGELENQIKQKAKDMGLNEKIVFVDFQEDIYRYYSLFDLFLMPSLFESFAMTLVEAQANGLSSFASDAVPTVSNVGGLVEYLPLTLGSSKWAEKILKKLETCSRENVSDLIEKNGFSLSNQVKTLIELYNN